MNPFIAVWCKFMEKGNVEGKWHLFHPSSPTIAVCGYNSEDCLGGIDGPYPTPLAHLERSEMCKTCDR